MSKLERMAWVAMFSAIMLFVFGGLAHAKTERSQQITRDFQLANPCPATGKTTGACPGWIKDHIIPLCKGGPDAVGNLNWQTVEDAKAKDNWECK